MQAAGFIAKKLKPKGGIAIVCIAISFLVMIISVAISSGFRQEIQTALSDISGDVQILPSNLDLVNESSPIDRSPSYMSKLQELDGVNEIRPVIYRAGMVKHKDKIHGVMIKGVEGLAVRYDSLSLPVEIPSKLSRILELEPGDRMLTYFVSDDIKVRTFKVASEYNAILESDDKLIVYADIKDLQRLNQWTQDEISAFEVILDPDYQNAEDITQMSSEIGYITSAHSSDDEASVVTQSSVRMFPQLFDWLNLIDFNVLFILGLMTLVAGFNMISGLLIMLFENISTIGLLKSLGMRDKEIAKTFLLSSSSLILKGMAIGNVMALAFCVIQKYTHILKLDPANYFVSHVPVSINLTSILVADFVAYIIIMLLLLIPSVFISRVDPAQTVRVR
jgi:lipoprotein-releasing system permease protein